MKRLIRDLSRRHVFKSTASYIVISWAILQAADLTFQVIGLPDNSIRFMLFFLVAGLPFWVIFSYIFDWSPKGLIKTDDLAADNPDKEKTNTRLNYFIIGGLAIAMVLFIAGKRVGLDESFNTPEIRQKSIAVIPFENLNEAEDSYFTRGVTEDILTQVSKIEDFRVLSNFTIRSYPMEGKSLEEIGSDLGVQFLVTGSIRKENDRIRINCQLIEVASRAQQWADSYDKKLNDIFQIQKEIAEEIALSLESELSRLMDDSTIDPTQNMTAYNIYLKGREEYGKYTPQTTNTAISYFKESIKYDPDFSLAYAGLSDAYSLGFAQSILAAEYLDSALILARKATRLNPQSAEAWKAWGFAHFESGLLDEAALRYEEALLHNPNYVPAISNLARIKAQLGEIDHAIKLTQKCVRLNPFSVTSLANLGNYYRTLEMWKESEYFLRKALAIQPESIYANYIMSALSIFRNQTDSAKKYLSNLAHPNPNSSFINILAADAAIHFDPNLGRYYLEQCLSSPDYNPDSNNMAATLTGYLLTHSGRSDSAQSFLNLALKNYMKEIHDGGIDVEHMYAIVQNYAIRGKKVQALKWLRQAIKLGYLERLNCLTDPRIKNLQGEKEFKILMSELNDKISSMKLRVSLNAS